MYKKIPKNLLLLAESIDFIPDIDSQIDLVPENKKYDLIVFVNKAFRMDMKYPESISDAEIYFQRGNKITKKIVKKALEYYSNCQINKGL